MAILKEDGSLDVERMNSLPLDEWMNEMGDLTQEQVEDYLSKLPINESNEPVSAVEIDYTLEDELKRGSVIAEDFINKIGKRYVEK